MRHLSVGLERIDLDRGDRRVLHNLSWQVRPGERWALLGHNGAGKTLLLKLLSGDVWPTPTKHGRRRYRWGAESLNDPLGVKEQIAYVGAERQDKYTRYGWDLTVEEVIGTGLFHTDIVLDRPNAAQRARIGHLLRRFGLTDLRRRRLLTLSYGQRRLALLARALAGRPRLLLLDEVFNGLDDRHRTRLMNYLEGSRRASLPWVLSAHRREDLPAAVTHVLILRQGRIIYSGNRTRAPLTQAFGRSPPVQHAAGDRASASRGARSSRVSGRAPALIAIDNAQVYLDYHRILEGITWEIRPGEHWAILGRNGSGKSTLLKLLYGDLSPAAGGRIVRCGHLPGSHIEDFKRRVGYLSPELQADYARDDVTVTEAVISGRHASIALNDAPTSTDRRAARRWLRFFALDSLAQRKPRELSYGQMRRVLLARAMINNPCLLLLDEPCTGLDAATRADLLAHLERLAQAGVQLVLATHHADDLVPSINRVLKLQAGRIRSSGPRDSDSRRGSR